VDRSSSLDIALHRLKFFIMAAERVLTICLSREDTRQDVYVAV
jgi:hypothetical protein